MDYSWRPRPATGNLCPVCSNSHFPFCPPPFPQYYPPPAPPAPDQFFHRHLPPQPPPPPPYDPFVGHQAPPAVNRFPPPPVLPPRPWNSNPSFNPGHDYDNSQTGVKRMRFDNSGPPYINEGYANSSTAVTEDERRLRLIRDHGAITHGLDRNYNDGYRFSNHFEPSNLDDKGGRCQEINGQNKRKYGDSQFEYQTAEVGRSRHQLSDNLLLNHGYGASDKNFEPARGNNEILGYKNALYQEQRSNMPTESWDTKNHDLPSRENTLQQKTASYHSSNLSLNRLAHGFNGQPPLPTSPPPPLPVEPPGLHFSGSVASSSTSGPGSLFPVTRDSVSLQSPYTVVSESSVTAPVHYSVRANPKSRGGYAEDIQATQLTPSKSYVGETVDFPLQHISSDNSKVIDASLILKHPYRASRPDHIVIILRGLPGSGKSYLAKILRDLEVENGGSAPRIHSMDDYFMTEVEKADESDGSKSSASVRGKKPVTRKVMEYCYEPEMEEAYRSSMLKAFKKTLDDGVFSFVIVDDRNLRVADFAQFWATAKRSGYEVYLLEAPYKDPVGCAARNVHGFTQNDVQKMANLWEDAPSLYMKLNIKSLLHGDDLEENGIQEVDMDTEDGNHTENGGLSASEDKNVEKVIRPSKIDLRLDGQSTKQNQDAAEERSVELVKELGKSKWSNDLDEDDVETEVTGRNSNALSGLIKSYSKQGKSVRWGDQVGSIGFSIGAGKTANVSLVIGPGSGYNLKSNPLHDEEKLTQRTGESRRQNVFQQQLRAERESFKAVFDKRRHRISGLLVDDE